MRKRVHEEACATCVRGGRTHGRTQGGGGEGGVPARGLGGSGFRRLILIDSEPNHCFGLGLTLVVPARGPGGSGFRHSIV